MDYERLDIVDGLPEDTRYTDDGCNLSPSCLSCPFPYCVSDVAADGASLFKKWRDAEIVRNIKSGIAAAQLEQTFGLSHYSVLEIYRNNR